MITKKQFKKLNQEEKTKMYIELINEAIDEINSITSGSEKEKDLIARVLCTFASSKEDSFVHNNYENHTETIPWIVDFIRELFSDDEREFNVTDQRLRELIKENMKVLGSYEMPDNARSGEQKSWKEKCEETAKDVLDVYMEKRTELTESDSRLVLAVYGGLLAVGEHDELADRKSTYYPVELADIKAHVEEFISEYLSPEEESAKAEKYSKLRNLDEMAESDGMNQSHRRIGVKLDSECLREAVERD